MSLPASRRELQSVGLHFSSDEQPGWQRIAAGRGFSYLDKDGQRLKDRATLARIRALAIPPAYKNVWICASPNGHLQATGIDARGRKQYRYHPQWRAVRDANKFERLFAFHRALPHIRRKVAADMRLPGMPRERVLATIVRLLDRTLIRVGNEQYVRENHSYGLTTLRTRHVAVRGRAIRFEFRGKAGVQHQVTLNDPRAAAVIRNCLELPGQELFQYLDEQGERHSLSSSDVNEYLRAAGGEAFSAKDFRTWYATVAALEALAGARFETRREADALLKQTLCAIAERLGNTPAMCRKCYVHPEVINSFLNGGLASQGSRRTSRERLLQRLQRASRTPDAQAVQPARRPRGVARVKPLRHSGAASYKGAA